LGPTFPAPARNDSVCALFFVRVSMGKPIEFMEQSGGAPSVERGRRQMAKRWYSVSVLSNFEKKIAEQIKHSVAEKGLEDEIDEVLVPTEEVLEIRRGKKVTSERRFMPGYVLVHMEMTDRGYHLITSINRVTGFLGPQGKPMPMRDAEVNGILKRAEEGESAPRNLIRFEIGEQVKVTDGPFDGFAGMVEDVDEHTSRLKVTVSIFGRPTPVELEFTQVQKVA
jgi:transcription termination/antitermination protein NusG